MYTQSHQFGKVKVLRTIPSRCPCLSWYRWVLVAVAILLTPHPRLLGDGVTNSSAADRAAAAYAVQRTAWVQATTNSVGAWRFARAAFDWSQFATNRSSRAAIAEQGIAACRQALSMATSAPVHYYLALNLGRLAETRGLSALDLIHQMEQELLLSKSLDETFDHAGADRTLGLLYRDAPGWPLSLGNWEKARLHLEASVHIDGEFPENRLALAELYARTHQKSLLTNELHELDRLWEPARERLSGIEWSEAWKDWEERRRKLGPVSQSGPRPP
jgi:hypothetical protein